MNIHFPASSLRKVVKQYENINDCKYTTVALGDSPNDRLMLENADIGILIPNAATEGWADNYNFIKAKRAGAAGWNEEILKLLKTGE